MGDNVLYTTRVALTIALGGFLMGFDASVISGALTFVEPRFELSKIQLGWLVACLTMTSTLAMLLAGPISDRVGRRRVLKVAACLFGLSAMGSALAPNFVVLVLSRMIGGLGVGSALIIAPMFIAEISPAGLRGRLVSLSQLNIVLGISVAYFSNYLLLGQDFGDSAWRWMFGVEIIPAAVYLAALWFVPESPRWLAMQGRKPEALAVLRKTTSIAQADVDLQSIQSSIHDEITSAGVRVTDLFRPAMRLVLIIGLTVAVLQQITGVNSVFFYAPMIFEKSGIGTDAAFMQAVLVGLVNLVFTVIAILTIDKLGRRPLLLAGLGLIAVCMFLLAFGFSSDSINPMIILVGILGFVAGFAVSLGPVMWVLFSELFPNRIRAIAVSFVGFVNSTVSFLVQLVFPWELEVLGNSATFLIYGLFAVAGLVIVAKILPETRGQSLEELEAELVGR